MQTAIFELKTAAEKLANLDQAKDKRLELLLVRIMLRAAFKRVGGQSL